MTTNTPVQISRDGGVATLSLQGRMPVISLALGRALADSLEALARDADTRVVVLRGEQQQFCAGGDIAAIRDAIADPDHLLAPIIDQLHRSVRAIQAMPQPVIASIAGAAAGGGLSLALGCDLIVCAADARFVVGYPALGTSSDGGLSYTLTRRVGSMRALDVMLGRGAFDAAQAETWGLVARVVAPETLAAETATYAAQLARHSPHVLREFKHLVGRGDAESLSAQLDAEKAAFLRCARTPEFAARVQAFLDRRK
ncbi:MAG TPA: enoyl-CoA hydratase-related protein [Solimonas sp.]